MTYNAHNFSTTLKLTEKLYTAQSTPSDIKNKNCFKSSSIKSL